MYQPSDGEPWIARARAFGARQRAFWSAQTAPNAPPPQAAGATESMHIERLAPGRYYFALKVSDAADNLSELSNVAEGEVE